MVSAGLPAWYIVRKLGVGIEAVKLRTPGQLPTSRPKVEARRRTRAERIKANIADYPNVSLYPIHIWKHW